MSYWSYGSRPRSVMVNASLSGYAGVGEDCSFEYCRGRRIDVGDIHFSLNFGETSSDIL